MNKKDIKIVLIDDEEDIREVLRYNLSLEGYQIFDAANGKLGIALAQKEKPHLILLDVLMPEMDGMETCEKIRKNPELNHTIIAFLTARSEDYSQLAGFEAGADDYIPKPIKPKLLISKINALLRRSYAEEPIADKLVIGNLEINRKAYKIVYKEEDISLPRKEFELFYLLAANPGKVFSREEILEKIWGTDVIVTTRTIDVHIRKLREKINEAMVITIKGVGYKFDEQVFLEDVVQSSN